MTNEKNDRSKQRKRGESKETKQPYSDWLKNKDLINKLKRKIDKVGYPLEFAAKGIFLKHDYEGSNAYYSTVSKEHNEHIWKEIDIFSSKTIGKFDIKGCTVSLRLFIIADCKYSSTNDILAFEDKSRRSDLSFPILYNAENFFESNLIQYFKFPLIIQNLSEVDIPNLNFHGSKLNIYDGCCQIINAFSYFIDKYQGETLKDNYIKIYQRVNLRTWFNEHPKYRPKRDGFTMPTEDEISKSSKAFSGNYLSNVKDFEIAIGVPLIIIGENNGLIKVKMGEDIVEDFVDVGYGAYLFAPNIVTPDLAHLTKRSFEFPMIIANLKWLENLIENVENSVKDIVEHVKEKLSANPDLLYLEVCKFIQERGLQSIANRY